MSELYHDTSVGESFIEGCLERIGEDSPEEEQLFRDLREDETQREVVIESLKADCQVRRGRPKVIEVGSRRSGAAFSAKGVRKILQSVDLNFGKHTNYELR